MNLKSTRKFELSLLTVTLGRHICFMGGGSAPAAAPTSTTVTNTNLPDYLQPAVERNVAAAEAATNRPYQAYGGQRTAGFNANQANTQAQTMGLARPGQIGQASTILGAQDVAGAYTPAVGATGAAMGQQWTTPGVAAAYMNPYQQNVTDIAKREATRQSDIQGVASDAQFAKAGAFGGSRQGVVDAERMRNLGIQQQDIQAQGANQAYQQGMGQFNADVGRYMQGAGQLGSLAGQQLGAQQAQAMDLAQVGGQQQGLDLSRLGAQGQVGQQQQALTQQQQDISYQDFLNQRDYAKQQANYMAGIIHGTPVTAQSNVTGYQAPPSMAGQVAGLGIAGLGAYNAMNKS